MSSGIDPFSDRAVYRQVADYLRVGIASGEFAEGERLLSETELIERFGASRGTVRQAVALVRDEGLVQVEQGGAPSCVAVHRRGGCPTTASRVATARRARPPTRSRWGRGAQAAGGGQAGVGREPASAEVAGWLRIVEGDPVLVRARRYLADGYPMEVATSYVPWALAEGTPMTEPNSGPGGICARLEEAGHILDAFTEDVSARMSTIAFDRDDTPVEACDTVMAADRYVLAYKLPAD